MAVFTRCGTPLFFSRKYTVVEKFHKKAFLNQAHNINVKYGDKYCKFN